MKKDREKPESPVLQQDMPVETAPVASPDFKINWTIFALVVILAFGVWIRLQDLGQMMYHHDESMHAYYSWKLYFHGPYSEQIKADPSRYNPVYHGPFLYHIGALFFFLFGDSDITGRLPFAFFGILTLVLAWKMKDFLGIRRALFIVLLLAISPVMTYFARFARNDVYIAFWCLGLIYSTLKYFDSRDPVRKKHWLWAVGAFLIFHYATKENTYAHGLIYCSFLGLFAVWIVLRELFGSGRTENAFQKIFVENHSFTKFYILFGWFCFFNFFYVYLTVHEQLSGLGGLFLYWIPAFLVLAAMFFACEWIYSIYRKHEASEQDSDPVRWQGYLGLTGAIVICFAVYSFLFTTVFSNDKGMQDGIYKYVSYWLEMHKNPRIPGKFWYYLPRLGLYETIGMISLVLAAVYWIVLAVARGLSGIGEKGGQPEHNRRSAFWWPWRIFLFYYCIAAMIIYGILQEKVPWLLTHQALPLALLAGTLFGDIFEQTRNRALRTIGAVVFGLLCVWGLRNNILLNCYNYDNPRELMVFVHTDENVRGILKEIDETAFKTTQGKDMRISVSGEIVWPVTWYLRHYNMTAGIDKNAPVIVADKSEEMRLRSMLGADYTVRTYDCRSHWTPDLYGSTGLLNPQNSDKFYDRIWDYIIYRKVWSPLGSPKINFYVEKNLVPTVEPIEKDLVSGWDRPPISGNFVTSFGGPGSVRGKLRAPRGVAVGPDGSIYVADSRNARIQKFSSTGEPLAIIGGPGTGPGQFNNLHTGPCGVAVSSQGFIYVADTWNNRIQKFTPDGRFVTMWGGHGSDFYGPRDLAIGPDGMVYVSDTGNKRIQKFDSNGTFVLEWGQPGGLPGEFDEPVGITTDSQGNVYVADTGNQRVQVFTSEGKPIRQLNLVAWEHDVTSAVEPYIAVDSLGRIFVTDSTRGIVLQIVPDGSRLIPWGSKGAGESQFEEPTGIAITQDGNVVVTDRGRMSRALIFRPR